MLAHLCAQGAACSAQRRVAAPPERGDGPSAETGASRRERALWRWRRRSLAGLPSCPRWPALGRRLLEPHACACQRWAHRGRSQAAGPPTGQGRGGVAPANQHVSHCPMERPFCSGCSCGNEPPRSPVSASPAPGLCGKDTTRAWPGLPPEVWDAASGVGPAR